MSYYNRDDYPEYNQPRRRSFMSTILLSLVSALIGGLMAVALVPSLYINQPPPEKDTVIIGEGNSNPPVTITDPGAFPSVEVAKKVGPTVVGIANFQRTSSIFGSSGLAEAGT